MGFWAFERRLVVIYRMLLSSTAMAVLYAFRECYRFLEIA